MGISANKAPQQEKRNIITGVVVDEQGVPIIGANIKILNDKVGTITDVDGNFKLNVPVGTKLIISYIGYTSKTVVTRSGVMKITLNESSVNLKDVEVVAYGSQKKVTITGAISSIKGDMLLKTPTGSVSNMLSGELTGITTVQYSGEPGADAASIFVRGQATWNNSAPLIEVDGVERSFNDIDPNDIASITVLKDASATAVFGVRGANGVILITTKRGVEGKPKITFSTSNSVIVPTATIKQANAYQYATFYNQMQLNDDPTASPMFSDAIIQKFKDHSSPILYPDVNWVDYCLKKATIQTEHNISISGGTKTARYFVSVGAFTQGGLFKEFGLPYNLDYRYNRFNYRSNLDIDITKSTTLSMNLAGIIDDSHKPYTGQGSAGMLKNMYWATPFSSPGLVDGKMIYTDTEYGLPFTGGAGMTYYGGGFMETSNNTLNVDLSLTQNLGSITKGLSAKVKGSMNSGYTIYKQASSSIATYTPSPQSDGTIAYKMSGQNSQLAYTESEDKFYNWYMEAGFNYDRTFGYNHVTGLLLYNESKTYYPSTYSDLPSGYVGLVGRATYDWKSKYLAEFDLGYNGSENFAPAKRFGTFPAGSVGWIVSEERFWKPIKPIINYLKFRASMGLVGNDKVGGSRFMYTADPYQINNTTSPNRLGYGYYFGIDNGTITPGAHELAKNNPNVTWEHSFKQDYGMDFYTLNERLQTSVDYYKERRKDILLQDQTAPGILGFTLPYANLGRVNSWGWELALKWNDKIGNKFRYYLGLNLSYNQNKIIEAKEAPLNSAYQYAKGHRIGARSMYQFFEFYNSKTTPAHYMKVFGEPLPTQLQTLQDGDCVYVDLNHDGKIDPNDMTCALGHTDDPEYIAGINMGFSWKNFDVSLLWTGTWGVTRLLDDLFRRPFISGSSNNQGGLLVYQVDRTWTTQNPSQNSYYPRATWVNATNNYATSTLYEKDASYLRLKSLQVAYNFHLPFMRELKMNSFQVALTGYNILTFTKYIWGDPESRATGSPTYPLTKTYSLNLRLGF
jgi:TonB-linked SusC/RagA family outer membrane protein